MRARLAVIVGGAIGAWEERDYLIERLLVGRPFVSIAINDAGTEHPDPLDHWVSAHRNRMDAWISKRLANGLDSDFERWADSPKEGFPYADGWLGGGSGLTAVEIALERLRLRGAVVCGCPLDGTVNAYSGIPWEHFARYGRRWSRARSAISGRLKSLSGWTCETFGAPTPRWLDRVYAP